MSALAEQPFNEHEQRYFLAEILKTSSIPPADLVRLIRERGIQPRWNAMALPNGRSVDACAANFNYMMSSQMIGPPPPPPQPYPFFAHVPPPQTPKPRGKRPSSEQSPGQIAPAGPNQPIQAHPGPPDRPIQYQMHPGDLPIQARPPNQQEQYISLFPAVNEPSGGMVRLGPEAPGAGSDRKAKKRGRPSKAEYEERAAQARARGEVYPPPKRVKNQRTSEGGATTGEEGEALGPGGTKKILRKPGGGPAPGLEPASEDTGPVMSRAVQRKPSVDEPSANLDEMEVDTPEGRLKSTIPETQPSESAASPSQPPMGGQLGERTAGPTMSTTSGRNPIPGASQSETIESSATIQQEGATGSAKQRE